MTIEEKQQALWDQGFDTGNAQADAMLLDNGGAMQAFDNATIYAGYNGDAFEVHGAILGLYITIGASNSILGFPVSDEQEDPDVSGGRISYFEHGHIAWDPYNGARVTADAAPIQDAGSNDPAGAPEDNAGEELSPAPEEPGLVVPEITITADTGSLAFRLQAAANYAYTLLSLSRAQSKQKIFQSEQLTLNADPAKDINWCGYTLAHIYKQAGCASAMTSAYFASTLGLIYFGSYYQKDIYGHTIRKARNPYIMIDGAPQDLEAYHATVTAARTIVLYDVLQTAAPQDIWPGDIVLLDHNEGGGPDHIQMVYQWDEASRVLVTIDGNGGSFISEAALMEECRTGELVEGKHYQKLGQAADITGLTDIQKAAILEQQLGGKYYLPSNGDHGRVSVGCHILTAEHQKNPAFDGDKSKHKRIFAIIRPSAVDFEDHEYRNL